MTAVLPVFFPTAAVHWYRISFNTIEPAAAASAMKPGLGRTSPLMHAMMSLMPPLMSFAATMTRITLIMTVAMVSNLPCPNLWSRSLSFEDMWVNISTTASLNRSDSECTPSAIMAALLPKMPAMILPAVSSRFTAAPHNVTLFICFCLSFISLPVVPDLCLMPEATCTSPRCR